MKKSSNNEIRNRIVPIILTLMLVFLFLFITGCSQTPTSHKSELPISKEGFYLDTICTITIYDVEGSDEKENLSERINEILDGGLDVCSKYEGLLSKTVETSDISRINTAKGSPVKCDPSTVELIKDGIDYGFFSEGNFNIGIGRITDLWDFHAMNPELPSDEAIKDALGHVYDCSLFSSYILINIDEDDNIRLSDPEAKLDLGGIAKGYIADKVADYLIEEGVTGAVVDLGGNIVVLGYKDGEAAKEEIRVGIKLPYTETNEIVGSISLHDSCVVTSGIYERYFEVDGVKYHHVLDPRTGYPTESGLESVTVIGPLGTSEDCDALATTVLMCGEDWLINCLEQEAKGDGSLGVFIDADIKQFFFILIRADGSINTLGNSDYRFE